MRRFGLLIVASLAYTAVATPAVGAGYGGVDYGPEFDDVHWTDLVTGNEDPMRADLDIDEEFEADDILALNLSHESQRIARKLGFRMQRKALKHLNLWLYRLRPPRGMASRVALATLRKADPKGFYDVNATYGVAAAAVPTAAPKPAPPIAATTCVGTRCYGQDAIGWGTCAMHARIGMVDTAIDPKNPALAGRAIRSQRFSRGDPTVAQFTHGTAVAALLIGVPASGFPGLLPQSELVAADVFSIDAQGHLQTDAARLAAGLDWVIAQAPGVINVSISGPDNSVVHAAIKRVVDAGITLVAAAGNQGPAAPPQYPAAFPEVIAVTAVDRELKIYTQANQGPYIELSAPGVGIWTAADRGAGVFREGTSFATPFVAAAIARLKSVDAKLAPAAIRAKLESGARDLGPPGRDPVFGAGLVQAPACAS